MAGSGQAWTRREWLQVTGAGAVAALAAGRDAAAAPGPKTLGVQLYTVRDRMQTDPEGTLKAIAEIGYKEVEHFSLADLGKVVPFAKSVGLTAPSLHVPTPLVTGNWAPWRPMIPPAVLPDTYTLEQALDAAKAHGVRYAVLAYLMPHERNGGAPFYETLAAQLNKAGEKARKAGLRFGYHNHGFEFEKLPDGRRPLDILIKQTDPALVTFELDVFWVAITGADPAALLREHKGRIDLVHLKDKAKGAPTATQEMKVPPTAFAEVGSGTLDFPAILAAAAEIGVKHYFVEQDHTPGDPVVSLRKSYQYLSALA